MFTITVTNITDGKKKTSEYDAYKIPNKEARRAVRPILQDFFDTRDKEKIYLTDGSNAVEVRNARDIAVSPLRKSDKKEEGYLPGKPPPYGESLDGQTKFFKKILRIVEGVRGQKAKILRHLAEEDDEFVGSGRGGAGQLRKADVSLQNMSIANHEKVMASFSEIAFNTLGRNPKINSKNTLTKKIIDILNTETDSPKDAD